jgi:predicted signal transduction protein with EAL and GGDEF domain
VARLGGDEFAVVQIGLHSPEEAGLLAQRVIAALSAPYEIDGHHVVVGTSVGIALAPTDSEDADQLLKSADMALYRAKADGRGVYRFFEPAMDARMQARRALELDLRRALGNGELEIHYQPLVNVETGNVSAFEALLRWRQPQRGMVSAAEFIPLAEEIGLIGQIGAWVLKEACKEAMGWPADVRLAVNLSAAQFKSRPLVLDVMAALGDSGLPASRLELEITETVMLHNTEATLAVLHELRELGVRISMDDFGTGYSSLSYLRTFPFDKIKIDRSFVQSLPDDQGSSAIIRAVTDLSASLGMTTTAEGVESYEQLAKLRAQGCTEVQGFLFSPARPAGEIAGLLDTVPEMSRNAA